MLSRQITLLEPLPATLTPLLGYSCKLFVAAENVISIVIKQIQTLSAKHPGYGHLPLPSPSAVPAKSFIYCFYADFPANSFIYRIYAKHTGCGVPPFRRSDLQTSFHRWAVSFPQRLYCQAIAPNQPARHHCQGRTNSDCVRCPSL